MTITSRTASRIGHGRVLPQYRPDQGLAGCDNSTTLLLDDLGNDTATLPRALSPDNASGMARVSMDEATFRWQMNADAMGHRRWPAASAISTRTIRR